MSLKTYDESSLTFLECCQSCGSRQEHCPLRKCALGHPYARSAGFGANLDIARHPDKGSAGVNPLSSLFDDSSIDPSPKMAYYSNESAGAWRPRQKKYHKKTRTGCDTCRTRRVKCDENRPECKNCIKTSRECTGVGYGVEAEVPRSEEVPSRSVIQITNSVPALVVGGRIDPFNSFSIGPAPKAHQRIFDYAIHAQWTHFAPTQQHSDLVMVKKHVMAPIISSPVAYHSFLYSGACHAMFWSGQPIKHAELLRYKNQALNAMRTAIETEGIDLADETLFCMILLAAHGTADDFRRRVLGKVQGRKALMFTMDAEFYCALEIEWQHMEVFYKIMKRREVRAMSPGPLWTATAMFDVFSSYMHSRRPQLRPLVPIEMCPYMRTWEPDEISLEMARQTDHEFSKVLAQLPTTPFSEILHGLVIAMADMDHYRRNRTPVVESVIVFRSMYIRELLLLPETIEASELQISTYQMCRLSCLLALQTWLFPDTGPNLTWTRNLPRRFAYMLPPVLDRAVAVMLHETLSEFYTWTVIMGLMLAYEDFDNFGDREAMRKLVPYLDTLSVRPTPTAWNTIKCVVCRFLWCDEDCDETGKEAWEMACQMYADRSSKLFLENSDSPWATSDARSVSREPVDLHAMLFGSEGDSIVT